MSTPEARAQVISDFIRDVLAPGAEGVDHVLKTLEGLVEDVESLPDAVRSGSLDGAEGSLPDDLDGEWSDSEAALEDVASLSAAAQRIATVDLAQAGGRIATAGEEFRTMATEGCDALVRARETATADGFDLLVTASTATAEALQALVPATEGLVHEVMEGPTAHAERLRAALEATAEGARAVGATLDACGREVTTHFEAAIRTLEEGTATLVQSHGERDGTVEAAYTTLGSRIDGAMARLEQGLIDILAGAVDAVLGAIDALDEPVTAALTMGEEEYLGELNNWSAALDEVTAEVEDTQPVVDDLRRACAVADSAAQVNAVVQ